MGIFIKIAMLFFLLNFFYSILNARPISYAGGWTVMTYNDYTRNSLLLHYSPTSKYSIGYRTQYWQEKEYWINSFNLNYLAKRINRKHSQTNIYLKTGLGILSTDYKEYNDKKEPVFYGEFAADWETRKLFISYNNNVLKSASVDGTFIQKSRFGFTPYLAKYGSLHTWLMYELNHIPELKSNYLSNFIIRFFKSTNLLELGLDENKNTTLNFIKRF
ncbi:MAG: hypothetical protein CFH34_01524 [Alphaproteobacteria bacterium MarineAlpha9_Bin4]|nr:hypothetical protein [Pelagibacterales bacterium]PPR25256.1 MAG: hypothetical protein CFH34_01524 [Alphaproteobacteria bacterium MarineAlpha9_Bin4]|tara:strand:+ start:3284 stop:3934 length:651 start_codon:yes stop_codon:yes gene_type:complete